jgi:hypothetical protein
MHGIDFSRVPVYKSGGQAAILGFIMANYAFVTTVPSWCSEKVQHFILFYFFLHNSCSNYYIRNEELVLTKACG